MSNETIRKLEDAGMLASSGVLPAAMRTVLTDLSPDEVNILLAIKQPLDVVPEEPEAKGYAAQFRRYAARLQGMTFAGL